MLKILETLRRPKLYIKMLFLVFVICTTGFVMFHLIISSEVEDNQREQIRKMENYFDNYYASKSVQLLESSAESAQLIGEAALDKMNAGRYTHMNFKAYVTPILLNSPEKYGIFVLYKGKNVMIADYFYKSGIEIIYDQVDLDDAKYYFDNQGKNALKIYEPTEFTVGTQEQMLGTSTFGVRRDGELLAVVGVDYVANYFNQLIGELKLYSNSEITMVTADGYIVASEDRAWIGHELKEQNDSLSLAFKTIVDTGTTGKMIDKGDHYLLVKSIESTSLNQKWYVVFKVMKENSNLFQSSYIRELALTFTVLGFLMMIVVMAIVVHELRPIEAIVSVLHQSLKGDYQKRINIHSKSDLMLIAEAVNELLENVEHHQSERERRFVSTITALAGAIDAKDHYTGGHGERVALYAKAIAEKMGLSYDQVSEIYVGAMLHDIGKIGIPDEIIQKKEKLTSREFHHITEHPMTGFSMLSELDFLGSSLDIVKSHHEKYNGSGYPEKLAGEDIDLGSRIVCVADAFDAMTSFRVYREPLTEAQAISEIEKFSGIQFDPNVVKAFLACVEDGTIDVNDHYELIRASSALS